MVEPGVAASAKGHLSADITMVRDVEQMSIAPKSAYAVNRGHLSKNIPAEESAALPFMPLCVLRLVAFLIVLGTPLPAAAQSRVSRASATPSSPETEVRYLSGRGPKDAVPWEFTISAGRRSGQRTTIPVPSNWEQHGFGAYNYGGTTVGHVDEHGHYRTRFRTPASWNGRRIRIVFDGVMTDADVKVNGRSAGPVHHGAFYRFRHDITALLKPAGDLNVLEVDVAKYSANPGTVRAEQNGDYWNFGGIFRPVFLEA